jgi:NTP pyrophosphatase (non-canonical NTP hydrolase)
MKYTEMVLAMAREERATQETLRPIRNWGSLEDESYHVLNTVLSEETGEIARAMLELERGKGLDYTNLDNLRNEAIQAAAVALQIAEKATIHIYEILEK